MGIPRVLNIYEHYPFWFRFFSELKYRVILSPASSRKIYELGIDSIPSESLCFPAKIAHGHVAYLAGLGLDFIFYPCIPYERREFKDAANNYNCPIITSYPENIKNNLEQLAGGKIEFMHPFFSFESQKIITKRLVEEFGPKGIGVKEIKEAAKKAWQEQEAARLDIQKKAWRP